MSLYNSLGLNEDPLPIGTIIPYYGYSSFIPATFLLCDGEIIDESEYPELCELLGKIYSVNELEFRTPNLSAPNNYLTPSPQQGEFPSTGGLYPPSVATATAVALTPANIPSLSAGNFVFTPQTTAASNVAMAGRYTNQSYNSSEQGDNTPSCVKLDASTAGFVSITATSLTQRVGTAAPEEGLVFNFNADHPIQYGGIGVLYLIKARYYDPTPNEIYVQALTTDQNLRADFDRELPNDVRNELYNLTYLNPVAPKGLFVLEAEAEAAAIASQGQGGGTAIPYANTPTLSGFVIPAKPTY